MLGSAQKINADDMNVSIADMLHPSKDKLIYDMAKLSEPSPAL